MLAEYPEVIANGKSGYICELGDIDGIAEKAISILSDPVRQQKFSQKAVDTVKSKFCAESIVQQYEQLYLRLVD